MRPAELRSTRAGILFYPLSILVLILIFRDRLDIVAAAWGILAFGDGWRRWRAHGEAAVRCPWNRRKTWTGLVAFIRGGTPAAIGLSLWVAPAVPARRSRRR